MKREKRRIKTEFGIQPRDKHIQIVIGNWFPLFNLSAFSNSNVWGLFSLS